MQVDVSAPPPRHPSLPPHSYVDDLNALFAKARVMVVPHPYAAGAPRVPRGGL